VLQPATPVQGFLLAYVSGVIWYCGTCYWVMDTMHRYAGMNLAISFVLMLAMCFWVALPMGLFGLLVAVLPAGRSVRRALVLAPVFWVTTELVQSRVLGFPWNLLGTAQVDNVPLCRVASWAGVYGVSFEVALVNAALAAAFLVPRRKRTSLLVAGVAAAAALQAGVLLDPPPLPHDRTALLVQQNIPPATDAPWTRAQLEETLRDLSSLSLNEATGGPSGNPVVVDGIVWPESPAPFFTNDPAYQAAVSSLARGAKSWVLAGAIGVEAATPDHPQLAFNSAVLMGLGGEPVGRYDKIHLVPFGEFVPLRRYMPFMDMLTREVGEFDRGTSRAPLQAGDASVGVFICYESVFPGEVRQFAEHGAQVLINISNDGWYGDSGAYLQHIGMTRMRAIENDRWLLSATDTGLTASVDPFGRIVAKLPRKQRLALAAPYGLRSGTTLYARYGDWFAFLCAIISIVAMLLRRYPASPGTAE